MDRIREVRRASMVSSNGLSRRRQRITSLRDSIEDGQKELQETVSLRDRAHKKDREEGDRELLNRNKRRRGEKSVQGTNREEGEKSTDISVDNDEYYYVEEDRRVPRMLPANHPSTSSSISNQSHRATLAPARVVRSSGALRVADEMIGVPVPRKARTASVKRSQEYWDAGTGCYGEVQNHRGASTSMASQSVVSVSPSSSSFTSRKKLRQIGPKTRLQKISSEPPFSSSQDQDDIEFEVAEALYDLMKQSKSESFNKQDRTSENSAPKLDSKDATKSVCSPISSVQTAPQTSTLPQDNSSTSTPLLGADDSEHPTKVETGISSPKSKKIPCEAMVVEHMESIKDEASEKKVDPNHATLESGGGNGAVTKEEVVAPKEESSSCVKLEVDYLVDSTVINVNSIMTKQEMKFEIDLMAFPPMPSDTKIMPQDVEMKNETLAKVQENEEKTVNRDVAIKQELAKLDSQKSTQVNVCTSSSSKLQHQSQKQQNQSKAPILEGKKNAQLSSLPLPITVPGCSGSIPSLGYMPPLQSVMPIDGNTRSSTALQPPHFLLSQPRPKRCATHHYIARNVYYHQQLTKINHMWPAALGSESVFGAKQYNPNVMPSAQNMILGNPLQGGFPEVQTLATIPGITGKHKSSEVAKILDATQTKQLVLQQSPQAVPAANLLHGPAFIFPMSQHQTAVAATTSQSGTSKSTTSIGNAYSARGAPVISSSFPAAAAAVSFNYPNFPANEAPSYMAILQNNGYPFPTPTHIGMPPPVKGGTHPQLMPLFNGSFYSSPIFHPPIQSQQQQPHSQPLMQSTLQNTSTSSGSSSSHKQSQSQQQKGAKVSSNSFLTSTNMQLQKPQKQHIPPLHSSRKLEAENFAVPLQSMNFASMPPVTMGSGGGKNHGEQQHRESKGGMELIHPQAFALTFPSANSATSALNFSSMAQNPAFFQMLPDMARHGYHQIGPATQVTQQKNFQLSEAKTGADSTNTCDGRKGMLGKSPTGAGRSLAFSKSGCPDPSESRVMGTVFDGSARTFSFISSSGIENQPSRSTSGAIRTASVSVNPANSQQHQLQKQHMMQQQMHLQPAETDSAKPQSSSSELSSKIAAKFPSNTPVCSHAVIKTNSSAQSPHWRNSVRNPVSEAPLPSMTSSTISKYLPPQQQMTQMSFCGSPNSARSPQGPQIAINNQSASCLVAGSLPNSSITKSAGGILKSASTGNKGNPSISAVPSQQTENSSIGPTKKSSPVCGRNVTSILSTCPSQLSEFKY